jgi:hypothetical protein
MSTASIRSLAWLVVFTLPFSCTSESGSHPVAPELYAMSFANSEWSAPVSLGTTINTQFNEQGPDALERRAEHLFRLRPTRWDRGIRHLGREARLHGLPVGRADEPGPARQFTLRRDRTGALHRRASSLLQKHSAGGAGPRGRLPVKPSGAEG